MKKCIILPLLVGLIIVLFSCESMEGMLEQATENVVKDSVSTTTKTVGGNGAGPVNFKEGELLVAYEGSSWDSANYLVAKVLTEPSQSTKNEGEFLFVNRGSSRWTPWYFESYKPDPSELELGQKVFYCGRGRATSGELTTDVYREAWWYIGRITELDGLYKDVVEINGDPYQFGAIRLPTEPFD
jgi:hypothetical protein